MSQTPEQPDPRSLRPVAVSLSLDAKLKLDALSTMLQQPNSTILERAISTFVGSLTDADQELVESLAMRARQSLFQQSAASDGSILTSNTVTGKDFRFRGSLDDGLEVFFENSQPLRVTRESIDLIRKEIESRKGPALMGANFSPLVPNSIGEAIQRKHKLTPINLSYVVPLMRERGLVRAYKEGRNWIVEAITAPPRKS
jgi:predicted transcriptional regulator